jgi:hypothetical protein
MNVLELRHTLCRLKLEKQGPRPCNWLRMILLLAEASCSPNWRGCISRCLVHRIHCEVSIISIEEFVRRSQRLCWSILVKYEGNPSPSFLVLYQSSSSRSSLVQKQLVMRSWKLPLDAAELSILISGVAFSISPHLRTFRRLSILRVRGCLSEMVIGAAQHPPDLRCHDIGNPHFPRCSHFSC